MDRLKCRSEYLLPIVYIVHIGFWILCIRAVAERLLDAIGSGKIGLPLIDGFESSEPSVYWVILNTGIRIEVLLLGGVLLAGLCAFWTFVYRKAKGYDTVPGPVWRGRSWRPVPIVLGIIGAVMIITVVTGGCLLLSGFFDICVSDTLTGPLMLVLAGPFLFAVVVLGVGFVCILSVALIPGWYLFCKLMRYMSSECELKETDARMRF